VTDGAGRRRTPKRRGSGLRGGRTCPRLDLRLAPVLRAGRWPWGRAASPVHLLGRVAELAYAGASNALVCGFESRLAYRAPIRAADYREDHGPGLVTRVTRRGCCDISTRRVLNGVWGNWQPNRFWTCLSWFESRYPSEQVVAGSSPAWSPREGRPVAQLAERPLAAMSQVRPGGTPEADRARGECLRSSVGRAAPSYGAGHRFDPGQRLVVSHRRRQSSTCEATAVLQKRPGSGGWKRPVIEGAAYGRGSP
jgi:hypothetical protein